LIYLECVDNLWRSFSEEGFVEQIITGKPHDDRLSKKYVNLAEERLGSEVLYATDDFFAEKENLIKPGRGIFVVDKYTERGKWMDGWESRRKRVEGHDYADIKLGARGIIRGFDIDTNHFLGNHPPFASIEACDIKGDIDGSTEWTEILPKSPLDPGSQNFYEIENDQEWTHIRLHIYPDGGVARLRVYGEVKTDWEKYQPGDLVDLVSVFNQGRALHCNDMFFSKMENLIAPGRGVNMGDGWETKRRRSPGNDWVILSLGKAGKIEEIEIDTAHFKGNYPDRFSIEFCDMGKTGEFELEQLQNANWLTLVSETKLQADHQLFLKNDQVNDNHATHVRLNIFPDGGVSRLRLWGRI